MFDIEVSAEKISIHTTRVGGDTYGADEKTGNWQFQSTPPVWVVTQKGKDYTTEQKFQSTPPVWVVTNHCFTV